MFVFAGVSHFIESVSWIDTIVSHAINCSVADTRSSLRSLVIANDVYYSETRAYKTGGPRNSIGSGDILTDYVHYTCSNKVG